MTDFSKTNIHCSSIGVIMNPGKERTPKQKWETACLRVYHWQSKYDILDNGKRETKSAKNILTKIQLWQDKVNELDEFKDIEPLSKTAKAHLKRVYGYAKYGKWSAAVDKGTKYTNKGVLAEDDSIMLLSKLEGSIFEKNEERLENEFLTGIPDIIIGDNPYNAEYVIDIKTSWDIETFLDNLCKPLDNGYWWQLQGYLALTGAKYGEVSYCLVNTPESILNHEKFKLQERLNTATNQNPMYLIEEMKLVNNMTFDDIPEKDRRLRFLVERDDVSIEKVYKKVLECRKYLSEIEEMHLQGTFLAKEMPETEEIEEISEEVEEM